jgi:hypothetical protein
MELEHRRDGPVAGSLLEVEDRGSLGLRAGLGTARRTSRLVRVFVSAEVSSIAHASPRRKESTVHGEARSCQVGRPGFVTLPDMSFDYEEKPSTSRFVDVFWRTHDTSDGTYLAAADACWDMIFIRSADGIRALGAELPEDAVDLDQLSTLVSVYWFGRGGAGAANFLYEAAHAAPAWGQTHDRPQGFVAFGDEPLIRRILDPQNALPYWNQHARGGHFPPMEVPDLLVGDLRAFFAER